LSGAASSATNATFASSATNATFASSATNASAATNATYATSAGSATNATYATTAGSAPPPSTFNAVGTYCMTVLSGSGSVSSGGTLTGIWSTSCYFDGTGYGNQAAQVNLSGTWRWMAAASPSYGYVGIAIRIA
jgi:hypothetical protein